MENCQFTGRLIRVWTAVYASPGLYAVHYIYNVIFCSACNCDEKGSVHLDCDNQGVCECQPNVVGNRCDQCRPAYYGKYTGQY